MYSLTALIAKYGVKGQVRGVPSMFDILFTDADVKDYRSAAQSNSSKLKVFNEQVLLPSMVTPQFDAPFNGSY